MRKLTCLVTDLQCNYEKIILSYSKLDICSLSSQKKGMGCGLEVEKKYQPFVELQSDHKRQTALLKTKKKCSFKKNQILLILVNCVVIWLRTCILCCDMAAHITFSVALYFCKLLPADLFLEKLQRNAKWGCISIWKTLYKESFSLK